MIRFAPALSILAVLAAAPAAGQAARDYQLPPAPTPTPESRVQGPVDPDAPVPIRPRAIETVRPATPSPAPTPSPSPRLNAAAPPAVVLPSPSPTRAVAMQRPPAARGGEPAATGAPLVAETPNFAPASTPTASAPRALPSPSPPAPGVRAVPQPGQSLPWLWLALGGAVWAAGAGLFAWRRRSGPRIPAIVTPFVPAAAPAPGDALALSVEAMRLDRSVLNATVGYRVTVRNRTAQALTGIVVEGDLVSASGERPADQQLASPGQALTPRHSAERLAPGQSLRFEGQVRLPLSEASVIRQGPIGLLVPLLRVRATAGGALPIATTLVIGRSEGQAARPQPFRLDEPPRSYAPLAQRVLDAMPAQA